jgi:hypothetical protein
MLSAIRGSMDARAAMMAMPLVVWPADGGNAVLRAMPGHFTQTY